MNIPSGLFRLKARAALKGHWQTALLIALIVNLPTLLMQGISTYTGNDAFTRLQTVFINASRDGLLTDAVIRNEVQAMLSSTSFWLVRGGELIAWLIVPFLALGMYKWFIDRLRGQTGPVSTVFCRSRYFFRALGLHLLILLKILLWMLPGIALSTGIMALLSRTSLFRDMAVMLSAYSGTSSLASLPGTATATVSPFAMTAFTYILLPLVIGIIAVPGVMAALRYAMAEYIQAEEPETGILECVRRSKKLMAGNKGKLFGMMPVFLLWYLALTLVSSTLSSLGVVSLMLQMLASLALDIYIACSIAAFYLYLTAKPAEQEKEAAAAPAPENEELN